MTEETKSDPYRLTLKELRAFEPHLELTHVGNYECCILVFSADRGDVAAALPSGLELGPQSITGSAHHPVMVFAGEQREVRGVRVPARLCPLLRPIGLCMTYLEAAVAIPFVRKPGAGDGAPHLFCCTSLYLNELLPIYLGWLCGLPKQRGEFDVVGNSFTLRNLSSDDLFQIHFDPVGPFQSPAAFPHFTELRPMFEQTHIGQLFSLSTPLFSTFVCSAIDMKLATAQVQSVTVKGTLSTGFSPFLPSSFKFPGIDGHPLGAFRLRTTWELPPPDLC